MESTLNQQSNRPWLAHYPPGVPHDICVPVHPVWGFLQNAADEFPERIACHYYKQQVTYQQLWLEALRTATVLQQMGVRKGDRVGLLLPNMPETLSALNGIWLAGAVPVALSPLMVPGEIENLLIHTECDTVIGLDLLAPLILKGKHRPSNLIFTSLSDRLPGWQRLGYAFARLQRLGFWPAEDLPKQHKYNELIQKTQPIAEPYLPASQDELAYILPTGGTTGKPKAVMLSHKNLVANATQLEMWTCTRKGQDSLLAVLPFFHSYGLTSCALAGTALAATMILHHRFVPRIVIKLIEQHKPTMFSAVPAMLSALNDSLRSYKSGWHGKRRKLVLGYCVSGGAPLSRNIADEFAEHTGAVVVEGYGLSEASPVTHTGPLDGSARQDCIGLPLPGTEARIVDIETNSSVMKLGQVGELQVRGPQVMLGYWKDLTATDEMIHDGWLSTGDLAIQDESGYFKVVDRKKDLIITSGFNVYPGDVETVLRDYPGLNDVAIVGAPDERRGQIVIAVLAVADPEKFDKSKFLTYAREHLAKHKVPRLVEVMKGDLPRNFLGKILRKALRDQVSENRDQPDASVLLELLEADQTHADQTHTDQTYQEKQKQPEVSLPQIG